MVGSSFVSDAELNGYINDSYKGLYDLITEAAEDYNITQLPFTLTGSAYTYTLPTDFYKLKGLDDLTDPSNPRSVRKYNWNERNDFNQHSIYPTSLGMFSDVEYRIVGSSLIFSPISNAAKPYQLWYIPFPATLTADGDLATGINGWLTYVEIDAAIKCLAKEESNTEVLERELARITERIARMRNNRDQGLPEKVSRVRNRQRNYILGGGGGFVD